MNRKEDTGSRIADLGEFGFISQLLPRLAARGRYPVQVEPGDDACVVDWGSKHGLIATTDMLVEGQHFNLDWQSPEELGHKAVAVNLSDITAMGGRGEALLVALACPDGTSIEFLNRLYDGITSLCNAMGVSLLGGDTCQADRLILGITALGVCEEGAPVTISGAKPGERIYLSACPGMAGLGLRLLEKYGREAIPKGYESALSAHLTPQVPWQEAPEIARLLKPGAMTDVSDGIARDLEKICQASGVGAHIDFSSLGWHPEMLRASEETDWSPEELALSGGEDYCLLWTASPETTERVLADSQMLRDLNPIDLGEVLDSSEGFNMTTRNGNHVKIDPFGFDHFKQSSKA